MMDKDVLALDVWGTDSSALKGEEAAEMKDQGVTSEMKDMDVASDAAGSSGLALKDQIVVKDMVMKGVAADALGTDGLAVKDKVAAATVAVPSAVFGAAPGGPAEMWSFFVGIGEQDKADTMEAVCRERLMKKEQGVFAAS